MRAAGKEKLVPQVEEGITEIIWVEKERLTEYTSNTFPAIIDVLEHV